MNTAELIGKLKAEEYCELRVANTPNGIVYLVHFQPDGDVDESTTHELTTAQYELLCEGDAGSFSRNTLYKKLKKLQRAENIDTLVRPAFPTPDL